MTLDQLRTALTSTSPAFGTIVDAITAGLPAGWSLWALDAPPSRGRAWCEASIAAAERYHRGRLPPSIREGVLAFYSAVDGLAFAMGPPGMRDQTQATIADRPALPRFLGYRIAPLANILDRATPIKVQDDSEPDYSECGLLELTNSDLDEQIVPDTAAFSYSSCLEFEKRAGTFTAGFYSLPVRHSLTLTTDTFPGGYTVPDGDEQPVLCIDDNDKPLFTSFDKILKLEITEAMKAIVDTWRELTVSDR